MTPHGTSNKYHNVLMCVFTAKLARYLGRWDKTGPSRPPAAEQAGTSTLQQFLNVGQTLRERSIVVHHSMHGGGCRGGSPMWASKPGQCPVVDVDWDELEDIEQKYWAYASRSSVEETVNYYHEMLM